MVIERDGVQTTYHLTAKVHEAVGLKLLNLDPRDHPEVIEVQSDSAAEAAGLKAGDKILTFNYVVQRPGPSPWEQVSDVFDKTIKTISALIHSKQTGVGAKDLSGPVGILTILAAQVNTDYRLALGFLVLLNVNLAILNLLPSPVLDGGHIMMAIIEKIRRRPLSQKVVEYTTTAFALLLISFMLYVTFFDVKRFSVFKSMFKGGHQIEEQQKQAAPQTP